MPCRLGLVVHFPPKMVSLHGHLHAEARSIRSAFQATISRKHRNEHPARPGAARCGGTSATCGVARASMCALGGRAVGARTPHSLSCAPGDAPGVEKQSPYCTCIRSSEASGIHSSCHLASRSGLGSCPVNPPWFGRRPSGRSRDPNAAALVRQCADGEHRPTYGTLQDYREQNVSTSTNSTQ